MPPNPPPWRSILILSFHLHTGLPSGLFPAGLPTKTLYEPFCLPYKPHALPIMTSLEYKTAPNIFFHTIIIQADRQPKSNPLALDISYHMLNAKTRGTWKWRQIKALLPNCDCRFLHHTHINWDLFCYKRWNYIFRAPEWWKFHINIANSFSNADIALIGNTATTKQL